MRKNPLHYDLTSLDLKNLKTKMFRTYLKDREATLLERQEIGRRHRKGQKGIQSRPKKRTIQRWLPNHQVYVYPSSAFSNFKPFMNMKDLIFKDGTPIRDQIAQAQSENGFVAVADIDSLQRFTDGDQFTPFMMLHDIGEALIENSFEYIDDDMLDMNPFGYGFTTHFNREPSFLPLSIPLALPNMKLMDMKTRSFAFEPLMPIGSFYMIDETNIPSDLFAMYCKKEHLTVDDFIWIGSDKYIEYYNHREQELGIMDNFPQLTLQQKQSVVDYYNMLFGEGLKGMVQNGLVQIR